MSPEYLLKTNFSIYFRFEILKVEISFFQLPIAGSLIIIGINQLRKNFIKFE